MPQQIELPLQAGDEVYAMRGSQPAKLPVDLVRFTQTVDGEKTEYRVAGRGQELREDTTLYHTDFSDDAGWLLDDAEIDDGLIVNIEDASDQIVATRSIEVAGNVKVTIEILDYSGGVDMNLVLGESSVTIPIVTGPTLILFENIEASDLKFIANGSGGFRAGDLRIERFPAGSLKDSIFDDLRVFRSAIQDQFLKITA